MSHFSLFENHFKAIFPELFFIVAITIILLYGVIYNPSPFYKFPILTNVIGWLSIQTLLITIILIANENGWNFHQLNSITQNGFQTYSEGNTFFILIFNNVLIVDAFASSIKIIILLSAFSSILISLDYIKKQKINSFEYIILIMFSTLSMLFIVSSYDLISMYLAIELQSLCFYVLAAFQRNNEFSTEAGLKYFILGALSSGLLLFGESIIYGFTGITNFEELAKFNLSISLTPSVFAAADSSVTNSFSSDQLIEFPFVSIGLLFMLVAFLFKIGAVPFHMWTPDVYEGAPTSVTAFFAITPKIAILALLLRLCLDTFWDLIQSWQTVLIVCSLLSMFIGTLGALNQNKIKRLFAYSSIAHVGYLLIALATGTIEAVESLLIYIIIYILMIINVFGILLTISKNHSPSHSPSASTSWFHQEHISPAPHAVSQNNYSFHDISSIQGWERRSQVSPVAGMGAELPPSATQPLIFKWFSMPFSSQYIERNSILYENNLLKTSYPLWSPYKQHTFQSPTQDNTLNNLTRIKKKDEYIKYITDLSTLSRSNPILAATAGIIFFSNAGVPPLAGFYGKLNVFLSAVEASMYVLAFAAILCSVMGAFYSIRLIKIMYFHSMSTSRRRRSIWTPYRQISKENSILLAVTLFFTLFFFLYPSFLFTLTHSAALSLCL